MSQESLVEIRDLNFSYDDRPILTGINMTIPRGKVVAVMGSSGCGKTTTLRLIGGQLKPTSGEVRVGGQVVHELDADGLYNLRRRMGVGIRPPAQSQPGLTLPDGTAQLPGMLDASGAAD